MAAATGLDVLKNYEMILSSNLSILAIGLIASFASALLAIKWLLNFVQKHTFIPFGIYRILVALAFLII